VDFLKSITWLRVFNNIVILFRLIVGRIYFFVAGAELFNFVGKEEKENLKNPFFCASLNIRCSLNAFCFEKI